MPFRDGGWNSRSVDGNELAGHLLAQWRLLTSSGYLPQPYLPSFFRGLLMTAGVAQWLSPDSDPLSQGLQDVRLVASLGQFREMLSLQQFADQMDKYAAMMVAFPQRFDEALTLAADGDARLPVPVSRPGRQRRLKNSSAIVTALLLALAAIVVCSERLTADAVVGLWPGRLSAVAFVLLGVWLLRSIGRIR